MRAFAEKSFPQLVLGRRSNIQGGIYGQNRSDCRPRRLVHAFPPTGDGRFAHINGRKPARAIVAHVFNDALVNLAVFDSDGMSHSRTSVPLVQEGEAKPEHG
jgi:hypothetical protein